MTATDACWWLNTWKKLDNEWEAISSRGQKQLANAADSLQKTTYFSGEHRGTLSCCESLHYRVSSRLWELAHRCSTRLEEEVKDLAEIYLRMQRLILDTPTKQLTEKRRQRYEAILLEVLAMYQHELMAKSLIAAGIFETFNHDVLTMYLASWQMQPHINRQRLQELETLIRNDAYYCA
ncbi:uncharacterized protein PHALS_02076 [Plasmopara halstedii]|uniref:Uncharacterized protein n=1 Tax=Plasmopara halstedii TaxID=4781 RepID=A0A0P1AWF0_PLAHL|nr:uncharacterized protein PHALS_02076 [Plasmopara halstedii]CEG45804.1 hypothetical protein PHALS_02076 [Plasmopara halstedii]|eukprot:XP_024582173.1 hypothetical protein PHALS_02076 [Plasmopara halstedii]